MIICNYHDQKIEYVITSSDEQTISGKVDPLRYKTNVNAPGTKPWTVRVDLSIVIQPVDSPDAIVSYWSCKSPTACGGAVDPPKV